MDILSVTCHMTTSINIYEFLCNETKKQFILSEYNIFSHCTFGSLSVAASLFKNELRFHYTYLFNMQFRVLLCTALYFYVSFLYYSLHINNGLLADTEINTHILTDTKRNFFIAGNCFTCISIFFKY